MRPEERASPYPDGRVGGLVRGASEPPGSAQGSAHEARPLHPSDAVAEAVCLDNLELKSANSGMLQQPRDNVYSVTRRARRWPC
jgi:hypothetical protein